MVILSFSLESDLMGFDDHQWDSSYQKSKAPFKFSLLMLDDMRRGISGGYDNKFYLNNSVIISIRKVR